MLFNDIIILTENNSKIMNAIYYFYAIEGTNKTTRQQTINITEQTFTNLLLLTVHTNYLFHKCHALEQ